MCFNIYSAPRWNWPLTMPFIICLVLRLGTSMVLYRSSRICASCGCRISIWPGYRDSKASMYACTQNEPPPGWVMLTVVASMSMRLFIL